MNNLNLKEAYERVAIEYIDLENNDELIDILWHYMFNYVYRDRYDLWPYCDEFENCTGKEGIVGNIVNYILEHYEKGISAHPCPGTGTVPRRLRRWQEQCN